MPQPTKFEVLKPVLTNTVPEASFGRGRPSPYLALFTEINNLDEAHALPVKVDDSNAGYAICGALRKLAKAAGKSLKQRQDKASMTFYFWLTPEEKEAA